MEKPTSMLLRFDVIVLGPDRSCQQATPGWGDKNQKKKVFA
jgi:hypothetical protein